MNLYRIGRLSFGRALLLGLALASGLAFGGPRLGAEEGALSLERARALATARSPSLRSALLGVEAGSLAERAQAFAALPQLSAGAGLSLGYPAAAGASTGGLQTGLSLGLSETLYDCGASAALKRIDALATDIARASAKASYFSLIQTCDETFYGVLEAAASVAAARDDLAAARAHEELAQARFDAGVITRSDLLETQADASSKESALALALRDERVARTKLASLTGLSAQTPLESADGARYEGLMKRLAGLSDAELERFAGTLLDRARKDNPSLVQTSLAAAKAASAVDSTRAAYLPTLTTSWAHELDFPAASRAPFGTGSVSLNATLSLDFWTTKTKVDEAAIGARQAALALDEAATGLDLDLGGSVYDCAALARSFASATRAYEYAQSHYEAVLERYKLSSASSSDLSDAEALLGADRSSLISARYRFLTTLAALRSLLATETDELVEGALP